MAFPDPASVEQAFYTAFRELNLDAMRAVWSASPDASCIHPGGALLTGIDAVIDSWRGIFADVVPPTITHRVIRTTSDERLAVHTVEEHVSSQDGEREAVILATNVYIQSDAGWSMLAHHASLPLVESGPRSSPLH